MSHKYNKKIDKIKEKKEKVYNSYWQNVSKKMARKYFWECKILKKDFFKMTFPRSIGEYDRSTLKFYDTDFVKNNEILIAHYARINGLGICDVKLTESKSIYWFVKSDLFKV